MSIPVSRLTRDSLRALARADGVTLDEALRRLVRAERQRRMARSLAETSMDEEERAWLDMAADAVPSEVGG